MVRRVSTLQDVTTGANRLLSSSYHDVVKVADNIDAITSVSADISNISAVASAVSSGLFTQAITSANNAATSEYNAEAFKDAAESAKDKAANSEELALTYATEAKDSEEVARNSIATTLGHVVTIEAKAAEVNEQVEVVAASTATALINVVTATIHAESTALDLAASKETLQYVKDQVEIASGYAGSTQEDVDHINQVAGEVDLVRIEVNAALDEFTAGKDIVEGYVVAAASSASAADTAKTETVAVKEIVLSKIADVEAVAVEVESNAANVADNMATTQSMVDSIEPPMVSIAADLITTQNMIISYHP